MSCSAIFPRKVLPIPSCQLNVAGIICIRMKGELREWKAPIETLRIPICLFRNFVGWLFYAPRDGPYRGALCRRIITTVDDPNLRRTTSEYRFLPYF